MSTSSFILNYHDVQYSSDTDKGAEQDKFTISCKSFETQIDFLLEQRIPIVSLKDWCNGKISHEKVAILTFDDGYQSHFDIVLPLLAKRNISATFFPDLSKIGTEGYLNWAMLGKIADFHEIGSHGLTHPDLTKLERQEQLLELNGSSEILRDKLRQPISSFAFPFGRYNSRLVKLALKCNYDSLLTTNFSINDDPKKAVLHRWNIRKRLNFRIFSLIVLRRWPTFWVVKQLYRIRRL